MNKSVSYLLLLLPFFVVSCESEPFPKPRGYYRIDLPAKEYKLFSDGCAASFEIPVYSGVDVKPGSNADSCWFNVIFPANQAVLHCTYLKIIGPLDNYLNDAHYMAYSHEMKANAIESTRISRDSSNVHGLVFDLKGEVASQLQFFLTDSTEHFLRGALYFNNRPNPDSIAPVLEFVREDILHILTTLEWKQ